MGQLYLNNAHARLASNINSTATTIQLTDVTNFPASLASGDWFLLTLYKPTSRYGENIEVVKVTGWNGSSITCVRGHERTAVSHSGGELVESRVTAGVLQPISDKLVTIEQGAQVNTVNTVNNKTGDVVLAKGDVGLASVDNTSDADKPVSTATGNALALKLNANDASVTNSREWTAGTVSQVEAEAGTDNTRRAWTALRVRQAINAVVNAFGNATQSVAGWMSPTDKTKLDGIESGAQKNVGDTFSSAGTYAGLRAQATTAADVGLGNVPNWSSGTFDGRYLGKTAKAADADTVDGKHASDFANSSHNHNETVKTSTFSGTATPRSFSGGLRIATTGNHYNSGWPGIYGVVTYVGAWSSGQDGGALQIWTPYRTSGDGELSFRTGKYSNAGWSSWEKFWHSGNFNPSGKANTSGTYSGLRAQATTKADVGLSNVGNYSSSSGTGGNTHALRDASGDLHARLLRPTYTSLNTGGYVNYFWTSRAIGTGDNYLRPTTMAEVKSQILSGKAADSDKLAGLTAGNYLRSNATDYVNGVLFLRNDIRNETGYRDHGVYGHYDSHKVNHIWSMGSSYRVAANGANFGSLYGLAYKHTNNSTGGTMAGGHQVVWCQGGSPKAAMGNGIWTSGNVTAYSDIRVKTNIQVIPEAIEKVKKLAGYTFDRTDVEYDEEGEPTTPVRQTGVIAQEVLEVLPEAVTGGPTEKDPDGHYSVAYGNMVGLLIEAIKEQQTQIDELKRRIG